MQEDSIDKAYKLIDERIKLLRERQRSSSAYDPCWMEIEYACSQLRQLRKKLEEEDEIAFFST